MEPPSADQVHYVFRLSVRPSHFCEHDIHKKLLQGTNVHLDFEDELIRFCREQIEGRCELTKHNRGHKSRIHISTQMTCIQEVKGQTSLLLNNVLHNMFWPFYGPDFRHGGVYMTEFLFLSELFL